MKSEIVGNPSVFAIEWGINEAYKSESQMALGFFVIYVSGKRFGVRSDVATLMACSYDAVKRRILLRGKHNAPYSTESAVKIAEAIRTTVYEDCNSGINFFGLKAEDFKNNLISNEIQWAPDGDAAFDDGGHVLQFDRAGSVRLIAFLNTPRKTDIKDTVVECQIDCDDFYHLLEKWLIRFETDRNSKL